MEITIDTHRFSYFLVNTTVSTGMTMFIRENIIPMILHRKDTFNKKSSMSPTIMPAMTEIVTHSNTSFIKCLNIVNLVQPIVWYIVNSSFLFAMREVIPSIMLTIVRRIVMMVIIVCMTSVWLLIYCPMVVLSISYMVSPICATCTSRRMVELNNINIVGAIICL